jgi:type I restriction enzyme S subunit
VKPETEGLAGLPEGWCWASVDAVYRNLDGDRRPIKRELRTSGTYPYIGASGVIDTIDGYTHEGHFLLVGEDGANLLSRSKPIAFQMRGRAWVNNHAHVLQMLGGMPVAWGETHFNAIDISRYVSGSAQPKLPQGAMQKIAVPLAPLAEQHRIVAEVDRRLSVLDALDASVDANLARCARLRQSILKLAFEGRLVRADASADATLLAAEPEGPSYGAPG